MDERLYMGLFDGIGGLRNGLDYHLARQNVLVANLSHLDTPGYKPLDLVRTNDAKSGAFAHALGAELAATQPGHIGHQVGRQGNSANVGRIVNDPTAKAGADGNGVSVEREASKIAANQVRYDVLTRLVASSLNGLQWAANDGRGG